MKNMDEERTCTQEGQTGFEWVGFGICLAGSLAAAFGSVFVGAAILSRGREKTDSDGDAPPAD